MCLALIILIIAIAMIVHLLVTLKYSRSVQALKIKMRELWSDHVWWTREFLIATFLASPNQADAQDRLMQNQADIGHAFGSYYGENIGKQLTALLITHITQAVQVVKSLGNNIALQQAQKNWEQNAREIGAFIGKYTTEDMTDMMLSHLSLTTKEVIDLNEKNYKQSVVDFQDVLHESYMMSDKMAIGIARSNIWTMLTASVLPCCKH